MKNAESAITAIFGGKFRSVLRASGRPDSASVEEWRCLQLDIQVRPFKNKALCVSNPGLCSLSMSERLKRPFMLYPPLRPFLFRIVMEHLQKQRNRCSSSNFRLSSSSISNGLCMTQSLVSARMGRPLSSDQSWKSGVVSNI